MEVKDPFAIELERKIEEYFDNVTPEQLRKDIEESDPGGFYRSMPDGDFLDDLLTYDDLERMGLNVRRL